MSRALRDLAMAIVCATGVIGFWHLILVPFLARWGGA